MRSKWWWWLRGGVGGQFPRNLKWSISNRVIVTLEASLWKTRDTSCICMNFLKKDVYSDNATGGSEEKIRVLPIGVEPHHPDPLPLSYRKLVETEATTLGSCDKHPTYCCHWNVDRAIFVWHWRMVSISVRYLFYQLVDEKIKTWTIRFPDKENPNMEKTLLNWPIVLQYDVKAKYRLIFGKFPGVKFFQPSVRLTNQKPRAFVSVR